jgi:hypothetical protein
MSLLAKAERVPPYICRYVARKKHGTEPMSHTDIAKKSGLSRSFVADLSKRKSWKGIPVNVVDAFSIACGVDLMAPWETFDFLKSSKKDHLNGATLAQRKFIASLFRKDVIQTTSSKNVPRD